MDPEALRKMIEEDEFGLLAVPIKTKVATPEDRLKSSYEEVAEFVRAHGREPIRNPADMGETRLAMRLQAFRDSDDLRQALDEVDDLQLLGEPEPPTSLAEVLAADSAGLLASPGSDILDLKHVPKTQTMPATIARRKPCEDFDEFEPLFQACQAELRAGTRKLLPFKNPSEIQVRKFYVLNGVLVYVESMGEKTVDKIKKANARLRCIFENGTESDLLLQSLASNLYKDGRRVTDPDDQTLREIGLLPDTPMASVYILRSKSTDPQVSGIPDLHKIGSTKQTVEQRLANAEISTTFLGAPVEVVAEYQLPAGVEKQVEGMLHRIFERVRLDIWFESSGGSVAEANEWFAVPLPRIDEAIELIGSDAITSFEYDPDSRAFRLQS